MMLFGIVCSVILKPLDDEGYSLMSSCWPVGAQLSFILAVLGCGWIRGCFHCCSFRAALRMVSLVSMTYPSRLILPIEQDIVIQWSLDQGSH